MYSSRGEGCPCTPPMRRKWHTESHFRSGRAVCPPGTSITFRGGRPGIGRLARAIEDPWVPCKHGPLTKRGLCGPTGTSTPTWCGPLTRPWPLWPDWCVHTDVVWTPLFSATARPGPQARLRGRRSRTGSPEQASSTASLPLGGVVVKPRCRVGSRQDWSVASGRAKTVSRVSSVSRCGCRPVGRCLRGRTMTAAPWGAVKVISPLADRPVGRCRGGRCGALLSSDSRQLPR